MVVFIASGPLTIQSRCCESRQVLQGPTSCLSCAAAYTSIGVPYNASHPFSPEFFLVVLLNIAQYLDNVQVQGPGSLGHRACLLRVIAWNTPPSPKMTSTMPCSTSTRRSFHDKVRGSSVSISSTKARPQSTLRACRTASRLGLSASGLLPDLFFCCVGQGNLNLTFAACPD